MTVKNICLPESLTAVCKLYGIFTNTKTTLLAIGTCTGRGGGDAGDAPGQRADAGADGAGYPAPGPPRRHHGQDLQHCRHTHSGPVSLKPTQLEFFLDSFFIAECVSCILVDNRMLPRSIRAWIRIRISFE